MTPCTDPILVSVSGDRPGPGDELYGRPIHRRCGPWQRKRHPLASARWASELAQVLTFDDRQARIVEADGQLWLEVRTIVPVLAGAPASSSSSEG